MGVQEHTFIVVEVNVHATVIDGKVVDHPTIESPRISTVTVYTKDGQTVARSEKSGASGAYDVSTMVAVDSDKNTITIGAGASIKGVETSHSSGGSFEKSSGLEHEGIGVSVTGGDEWSTTSQRRASDTVLRRPTGTVQVKPNQKIWKKKAEKSWRAPKKDTPPKEQKPAPKPVPKHFREHDMSPH